MARCHLAAAAAAALILCLVSNPYQENCSLEKAVSLNPRAPAKELHLHLADRLCTYFCLCCEAVRLLRMLKHMWQQAQAASLRLVLPS